MNIIFDIPPKQSKGTYVGVDSEFFGMDENLLHLPLSGTFASLQIALPNEDVYVITDTEKIAPTLEAIKDTMWVLQKSQFDFAHLRRYANIPDRELLWDTLYCDKLIWNGYFEQFSFSLSDMVRRYFSVHLDKTVREQFATATVLTEEQIQYAAEDALWVLRVGQKQASLLPKDQYELIWQDIDLPATWAFLASKPFRLDRDQWEALATENERLKTEGDALLPFNPRSKQQVIKYWQDNGYRIENSAEDTLEAWIEANPTAKIVEDAKLALRVKKASTYANKYGMGFIEKYLFQEGDLYFIKPDYFTIGAETGRTSATDPPLQGIPSRETLAFRKCFVARPGHKLVIADYSSQEPRIAAYVSGDREFINVVNSGEDIYLKAGENFFSDPDENLANRPRTKDTVLANFYGQTYQGLARKWGIDDESAREFSEAIMAPYPKLARYFAIISKRKDFVSTVAGRKIWLNPYNFQCPNNARNAPIQGTAADMVKRAIAVMYRDWDKRWGEWALVECVHDEVGFDVLEEHAQEVEKFVRRKMIETGNEMCEGVLFDVDTHIVDDWASAKEK